MLTKIERILSCISPTTQKGLEIGALASPIISRDVGDVRYVDHETTAGLKAKYAGDPNVDSSKIVDVDYVWGEKTLAELVGDDAPFDYVIACHVIEHVPDLIGWLKEIRSILKPDGVLSLVVPDKRFTFDYARQLTKPDAVLGAFLQGSRKPTPRQIVDHFSSFVSWKENIVWHEKTIDHSELKTHYSIQDAWALARKAAFEDQYIDTHCWVFTPLSFLNLLKTLVELELFDFTVAAFSPTDGFEFCVTLRALNPELPLGDRQTIQLHDLSQAMALVSDDEPALADDLHLATTLQQTKTLLDQAESELQDMREDLQQVRQKLRRRKNQVKHLQSQIEAMETSKFWKLRQRWLQFKKRLWLNG